MRDLFMRYMKYAIVLGIILLAVLVVFLFFQYRSLRRQQIIHVHEMWLSLVMKNHGPLPLSDAAIIRPWMTFDYVNRLFGLPKEYLQAQLPVTDTHYPALTLSGYAREVNEDQNTFLGRVEVVVQNYATTTRP